MPCYCCHSDSPQALPADPHTYGSGRPEASPGENLLAPRIAHGRACDIPALAALMAMGRGHALLRMGSPRMSAEVRAPGRPLACLVWTC
jgi:hypothetical protein